MKLSKGFFRRISVLLLSFVMAAVSGYVNTSAETVSKSSPTEDEARAADMVQTIFSLYSETGGENEEYINLHEYHNTSQSGYLWSNFSGVGMQYYMCRLYPDDNVQKDTFRKMINNFLYFRQSDSSSNAAENSVKYHSARGTAVDSGYGDCFFDDNIWVARNYLRAYEILGDQWYLEEAIRINNWVLSGWNNELGGIVWSEVGLTQNANAQHLERGLSANACGIIVNAQLSELAATDSEKEFYLAWAERFYAFCKRMQNTPDSYDYWNGIHTVIENGVFKDGDINRVHYSYNSGSMILANLALYDCTTDDKKRAEYMDDALKTADAANKTFNLYDDINTKKHYYQGDPWFAAILNEAYYELYRHKQPAADNYMELFAENVRTAYSNRDGETGLCPYQAVWGVSWDRNESFVIHQIGFAEQAVLTALYRMPVKPEENPPEYIVGDVDNNKKVDVADILTIKNLIMAGEESWTADYLDRGDMNHDGTLTVGDMLSIKNIIMNQ